MVGFGRGILAALLLAVVSDVVVADESKPTPPNILFIFADDQRWDTIDALGNKEIQTPHIDRLVERGFHFNNAYCMGSMTPAVCLPSRSMLLTGRSLWRLPDQLREKVAPPGVFLLPTALREGGYATMHSGKMGNSCRFAHFAFEVNHETNKRTENSATEHGDATIRFLEEHDGTRPFFIYLAPPVPHDPRLAPREFVDQYPPTELTLSKNFMPKHPFDNGELEIRDELLAPHPRTPEVMKQHLADYYATISHLDHEVGRILETIAQRGWTEKTLVIYSSDQGLAVGGRHGLMGKQNLYEHFKSPLIVAGPGIPHGESDALVYLHDLFPTICDLAEAPIPKSAEGKSLMPIIRGEVAAVRDSIFCAYRECQRMVRDSRWKLVKYNAAGVRNEQLFDLAHDPDELQNLAQDPRFRGEKARLENLLENSRREFGDPVPLSHFSSTSAASSAIP